MHRFFTVLCVVSFFLPASLSLRIHIDDDTTIASLIYIFLLNPEMRSSFHSDLCKHVQRCFVGFLCAYLEASFFTRFFSSKPCHDTTLWVFSRKKKQIFGNWVNNEKLLIIWRWWRGFFNRFQFSRTILAWIIYVFILFLALTRTYMTFHISTVFRA